jgi:hypothetical protein
MDTIRRDQPSGNLTSWPPRRGAPSARGGPYKFTVARGELIGARTSTIRLDPDHAPERPPSIFLRRHERLCLIVE